MRAGHLIDIGSHFIEQSLKRERERERVVVLGSGVRFIVL